MLKLVSMMRSIVFVAFLIIIPLCTSRSVKDEVLDETDLLMTFLVHRHGDRAPLEKRIKYSTDPEKIIEASAAYGYGQLTKGGILRGYKLGGFIREHYNDFLSPIYNKSEIYIRSTDYTRAKMTVLAAMAAVYPLEEPWCEDVEACMNINWTPVPYTTVAPVYDYNLAALNCPTYMNAVTSAYNTPNSAMDPYTDTLNKWSCIIGVNLTASPGLASSVYELYNTQISLGIPLTPELEEMLPEIKEAADASMAVVYVNDEVVLDAGVLLNEFFVAANGLIAGNDMPRVHIYSTHDINVITFMSVTKVELQGMSEFGAAYALELRKDRATGQLIVVPIYLRTPDVYEVTYLQVKGCGKLCKYSKFKEIVAENILKEKEWRKLCEWSEDYKIVGFS